VGGSLLLEVGISDAIADDITAIDPLAPAYAYWLDWAPPPWR
jgi:hypothetical protein